MKSNDVMWKSLPIGTLVYRSKRGLVWRIVGNDGEYITHRDRNGKLAKNRKPRSLSHDFSLSKYNYTYKTSYGYQTPLWKVLNGENI